MESDQLTNIQPLQSGEALLDVAGIFTNRLQCSADVLANLWRILLFYTLRQLHHGRLQGQLVVVNPLQHIRQRRVISHCVDSFRENVQA